MKQYYVCIMTNRKNGVLYTGMTKDLERRVHEHKQKVVTGFTSNYNCTRLVYYTSSRYVNAAITAEKQIKGLLRRKKIALIESENPESEDLSERWK